VSKSKQQAAQAVIFDCDGVLVDTEPLYASAFAETLERYGMPLKAEFLQGYFHGRALADCYRLLARDFEFVVTPGFHHDVLLAADHQIDAFLAPMPGIHSILARMRCAKAVASNGLPKSVTYNLEKTGLSRYFGRHIYTAAQVAAPKPAPDLYLLAARELGMTPAACIVVEDSATGVAAAVAAGMQVCWWQHAALSAADHSSPTEKDSVVVVQTVQQLETYLRDRGVLIDAV
jgi:HAD superfamily hydrolase (TIGR01509 family)